MVLEVEVDGGGGCRVTKAGTIMKSKRTTRGSTSRRCGSKQMKEYTKRKERVWVGVLQLSRRSTRFWNRKTTPILVVT